MQSLLLAEDDPVAARFFQDALASMDYAWTWVTDGLDAWQRARTHAFDVLLLDLGLPGLPGDQVWTRVREDGQAASGRARAIAMSAELQADRRQQLLASGFAGVLHKPVSLSALQAALTGGRQEAGGLSVPCAWTAEPSGALPADWDDGVALEALGDAGNVHDLRQLLLRALPQQLAEVTAATTAGDSARARAVLHQMQSSSRFCGAARLAWAVTALGHALQQGADALPKLLALQAAGERLQRIGAAGDPVAPRR